MVRQHLIVAGSGKMARDIGIFFLREGHPVTWLSRDPERLELLAGRISKTVARLSRSLQEGHPAPLTGFRLYDDEDIPPPGIVIECINESALEKREVFRRLEAVAGPETLLLSASSSILPGEIHPRCIGAHFFYPMELTALAEVVLPDECPPGDRRRLLSLLTESGIRVIEQGTRNAFTVNRLLLPVQAECLRLLRAGAPPGEVEEASKTPLFPMGQLGFMDAVGLDVVNSAAVNYLRRMPEAEAADYAVLPAGLKELLDMGKRGRKNGDGFLAGRPLPWQTDTHERPGNLSEMFLYLMANTCYHFLERAELDAAGFRLVLTRLFLAESTPQEVIRRAGKEAVIGLLDDLYRRTGLSYFRPAAALR